MEELSNGRVRRTPEEWRELVERFSATGLSQREFCLRNAVNLTSFQRWYRRLKWSSTESEFVEVPAAAEDRSWSWAVEVELESGTIVRIRS